MKDDPKALKKSLKRIEKKKERSRKQWYGANVPIVSPVLHVLIGLNLFRKAREKALQDEKKELIQKKLDKRNHIVEKRMANKAAKKVSLCVAGVCGRPLHNVLCHRVL